MRLHFKKSGQGKAVILLHGLFGSADNWHFVAQRLAERFHVFAVDQRNHGQSPHDDEMDYPLMAADVENFFIAQKIASAFVIGHSMGGKTAMQFALQFPNRVEKLVVADMAPRAYSPAHAPIFAALLALDLPAFQTRQQLEDALAPAIPDLALRRFLLKNLGRNDNGAFYWKMNLSGLAKNYPQLCAALNWEIPFTKPTLFLRGGKSKYISAADEPEIFRLFPAAKIQTIAGANHWVHADAPEEFLKLVLDFL
jgi:pimeloyl-ACP methyl ester carboxylesterase